jgi:hypothetical protein
MATFTTYDAAGIKEQLADVIYNISPEETPFISNVGRKSVSNTLFEWQTDALASVDASNAVVEGADAGAASQAATKRMQNYTQISNKVIQISGTEETVDKAGRNSEVAYQMAKKSSELKRDMEAILTRNQVAAAGDSSSTARTTGSLEAWLRTNTSRGSGGTTDGANPTLSGTTSGYPNAAATDASNDALREFTETLLKSVVQSVWTEGGDPSILMVGPTQKQKASSFAGIAAQRYMAPNEAPSTIIGAADVYISDFGSIQIVPNRFQRDRTAFVLDPEYAAVSYLRDFEVQDLAKTGDSDKKQIIVEYGLEISNEAAHGVIADIDVTA